MKSTMSEKISMKSLTFPCLGKYMCKIPGGSFIVLFKKPNVGTVVYTGNPSLTWQLGTYSEEWEMDNFEYFNGEVVLRNEN